MPGLSQTNTQSGKQVTSECATGCFTPDEVAWCARCRQEERSLDALPRGARVGKLQVGRVLGAGGFGITYLARHAQLNSLFAIKEFFPVDWARRDPRTLTTVRPNSASVRSQLDHARAQFLEEAQRVVKLRHPHIVQVVDFEEEHETAYLVMPYYQGQSLHDVHMMRESGRAMQGRAGMLWSLEEIRQTLSALVDALDYLHSRTPPVLHRDIKPGNIFLEDDGTGRPRIILLDFGAAREIVERSRGLSRVYTPGFAAPEQILGLPQGPDTDGYAVAAVAYFLLTNRTATGGRDTSTAISMESTVVPPNTLVRTCPDSLSRALVAALSPERSRRLSARQLLETLSPSTSSAQTRREATRQVAHAEPPVRASAPKPVRPPRKLHVLSSSSGREFRISRAGLVGGLGLLVSSTLGVFAYRSATSRTAEANQRSGEVEQLLGGIPAAGNVVAKMDTSPADTSSRQSVPKSTLRDSSIPEQYQQQRPAPPKTLSDSEIERRAQALLQQAEPQRNEGRYLEILKNAGREPEAVKARLRALLRRACLAEGAQPDRCP